ncbi:Cj0814 family flagellar-dependent secreted protein, partial [Campylobacter avium]|uniref:Cj0814 family flagellar-dependent secreted protein n=1 Tax=Campylobacter avium TaxID=522485 RepID=UPI0023529263
PLNANLDQTLVKDKSEAVSEILGYGVDKEGYFTSDFNEKAGLPRDFKIYAKDLENLVNSYKNKDIFTSIDIAKSMQNAYKVFSSLSSTFANKDFIDNEDLKSIAIGYELDIKNLNVIKTYEKYDEFNSKIMGSNANLLGHLPSSLHFTFSNFEVKQNLDINQLLQGLSKEAYLKDDKLSKSGLFVSFFANSPHRFIIEGKATVLGMSAGFGRIKSALTIELNEILTSGNLDDFKTILSLMSKHDDITEFKKEMLELQIPLNKNPQTDNLNNKNNSDNYNPTPKDKKPFTPIQAESKSETFTYDDITKNFFLNFLENERKKGNDVLELLEKLFKVDKSKIDFKV